MTRIKFEALIHKRLIMSFVVVIKLLLVLLALIVFLRRPNFVWGVGLLSVTTAVLLDTFLGTFDRGALLAELGFFYYIINGILFGGATLWAWGVLRPRMRTAVSTQDNPLDLQPAPLDRKKPAAGSTAFDRQMLFDEIRRRFGREDVLDLIFDLGISETDVVTMGQDMNQLIVNVMDRAEETGQTGGLALAVERILTPPPPENLPRKEKIDENSPATILRHYLLAHYSMTELQQIATDLVIDWEQLAAGNKKTKVRSLLLYLYRRNRISDLIANLHQSIADSED